MKIGNSVTSIGASAFCHCTNLENLKFSHSVTSIAEKAFYDNQSLKTVSFYGTKEEFESIEILSQNDWLTRADIFFENTQTTTTNGGKNFSIVSTSLKNGNKVILALYSGDILVEAQILTYTNEDITFKTDKTYTTAKVFVWQSAESMVPVCSPEILQ